jgi:hypothetical protein
MCGEDVTNISPLLLKTWVSSHKTPRVIVKIFQKLLKVRLLCPFFTFPLFL